MEAEGREADAAVFVAARGEQFVGGGEEGEGERAGEAGASGLRKEVKKSFSEKTPGIAGLRRRYAAADHRPPLNPSNPSALRRDKSGHLKIGAVRRRERRPSGGRHARSGQADSFLEVEAGHGRGHTH